MREMLDRPVTPWDRLTLLILEDRRDLVVITVYTLINGLLMLAVPLAAQSLVNIIAAGVFLQPLVVLSLILFLGLLFAGVIRLMKMALVEIIQQRLFAKVALRLAFRLPRIRIDALHKEYVPELANRFFDVISIQKTWAKILIDGPSSILQILAGLLLLAFYSPLLLVFDILLILGIVGVMWGLSFHGLRTSIQESYNKYNVAGWLEETGRCHLTFKIAGLPEHTTKQTDTLVHHYLTSRKEHFKVLIRQAGGTYLLYALASAGILAIGGWLVINRQLTLGQLVAAEIIVVSILAALEKLMRLIEPFYDLLTGMEKIGHVTGLPLEREDGNPVEAPTTGSNILFKGVKFTYPATELPVLSGIDFKVKPQERIALVGKSGSGKSTIATLLCGLQEPTHGVVEIDGHDIRDYRLQDLRTRIGWIGITHEIFEGTIEDNIKLGRPWITQHDMRLALEVTGLTDDLTAMPQGKKTRLTSEGRNLSHGQRQRLMIARGIVDKPSILILDETFTAIEARIKRKILDFIMAPNNPWTVICMTHSPDIIKYVDRIIVIDNGQLIDDGTLEHLIKNKSEPLAELFPGFTEGGH